MLRNILTLLLSIQSVWASSNLCDPGAAELSDQAPLLGGKDLCPIDVDCDGNPEVGQITVYPGRPAEITRYRVHETNTTYTMTSTAYEAIVSTYVTARIGKCSTNIIVTAPKPEVRTVWVDVTTVANHYTSVNTTVTLVTPYGVAEVTACMKTAAEIGATPTPASPPVVVQPPSDKIEEEPET